VLSEVGAPTPVAWTRLRAPRSLMGTIGPDAIAAAAKASPLQATYGATVDRDSAFERLSAQPAPAGAPPAAPDAVPAPVPAEEPDLTASGRVEVEAEGPGMVSEVLQSSAFKSFLRSAATVAGREITRSLFGTTRRR
jgi:hypothetical protein